MQIPVDSETLQVFGRQDSRRQTGSSKKGAVIPVARWPNTDDFAKQLLRLLPVFSWCRGAEFSLSVQYMRLEPDTGLKDKNTLSGRLSGHRVHSHHQDNTYREDTCQAHPRG